MRAVRWSLGCVLLLAVPGLSAQAPGDGERRRAVHALSRLTFGARPGDVDRLLRIGVDRWIDAQLRSGSALDSATVAALAGYPTWIDPLDRVLRQLAPMVQITARIGRVDASGRQAMMRVSIVNPFLGVVSSDSLDRLAADTTESVESALVPSFREVNRLMTGRLMRMERSDAQLREVMTDFWANHFSLYNGRVGSRASVIEFDRGIIRDNALGSFRTLLGAVAKSPAMLTYLDNVASRRDSLNENYGRELLELHTLGVDGGYTQADVIATARALTGWTHDWHPRPPRPITMVQNGQSADIPRTAPPPAFDFRPAAHDSAAKTILGRTFPAGRGIEDGEELLDLLARHPSTARHIARKLAVRFVSDAPPAALVERAAQTFLRSDGNIAEVMRTIVTSPEFFAEGAFRAKLKKPTELVLSLRRALDAPVDSAGQVIDFLIALNQPPFGRLSPDGWPEHAAPWAAAGAMLTRVDLATRVGSGAVASIPLERWSQWDRLSGADFDVQRAGVIDALLGGVVSADTRRVMESVRPAQAEAGNRERTLRDLVALALASPEFQHR
jgi:uncharacterized protein (DUF1800 family)